MRTNDDRLISFPVDDGSQPAVFVELFSVQNARRWEIRSGVTHQHRFLGGNVFDLDSVTVAHPERIPS
jgi:hypothetical protein